MTGPAPLPPIDLKPLRTFKGEVPVFVGFSFRGDRVEHGLWERYKVLKKGRDAGGGSVDVRAKPSAAQLKRATETITNVRYQIATNPLVSDMKLTATLGEQVVTFGARQGGPLYARVVYEKKTGRDVDEDDPNEPLGQKGKPGDRIAYHGYLTAPVPAATLLELLVAQTGANAAARPRWRLEELWFRYDLFFKHLLAQLTDPAPGTNLADASSPKAAVLLGHLQHRRVKGKVDGDPEAEVVEITDYDSIGDLLSPRPMTPVLVQVAPPPRQGLAPLVKLWFDLEFDTATRYGDPAAATKDHGEMRALIAAEWSMLARFAATTTEAERDTWTPARRLRLEAAVKTMSENVGLWLLNHTDLSKGEAMLDGLVQQHLAVPADQLAGKLRDALDKRLIIANHWGQNEEDLQLEAHQRVLSDLFGTLHHSIARVSPVAIMREVIAELLHLDMREEAALALQYGVGHCQEHANVSFAALKGIKDGGSPEVTDIILSGFSNIDHAFVVFNMPIASGPKDGLTPAGVWITTTTTWARDKAQRNQIALLKGKDAGDKVPLSIWNLTLARQAERQRQQQQPDPRGIGRVLDPYLSSTGRTAAELETALGKMPAHQGTTWLWVKFYEGHPVIVQANGKAFSDFRVSVPGKRDDVDRSFPREDFFPNV